MHVMRSRLFYTDQYLSVQATVREFLNAQSEFLSPRSLRSTRAVGDAVQDVVSEHFETLVGSICSECSKEFARRAMADVAFTDPDGLYYVVDVKTH